MYTPEHFAETRLPELQRLIVNHPLGVLITYSAAGLDANHLPFELDPTQGPYGTLRAHVARKNPIWQQVPTGTEVLVVFRGVAGYISPNWYPSKHETHQQVPTWNYEAVHVHGRLVVRDDEKFVRGVVARLTRTHEASEPKPWKMGDSEPGYIDSMLQAIVGLEIEVLRLEGKFKLSQNKDERDRSGAASALQDLGHEALAARMRQTMPPA